MLENFNPETPSEMMLWNEIKRLRRELQMWEFEPKPSYKSYEAQTTEVHSFNEPLKVVPGAHLLGNIQPDGSIKVLVRGLSEEGSVHLSYYVSPELLFTTQAVNMAEQLHRRCIAQLVEELQRPALVKEQTG